jgi:hypothetical protein
LRRGASKNGLAAADGAAIIRSHKGRNAMRGLRGWVAVSMLVSAVARAVPGAAPVELCDYTQPAYSAREVAAVRAYGRCLSHEANARAINRLAQRCNERVNAAAGRSGADARTIECGSGPEHRHCEVSVAIGWCTTAKEARKDFPDLYPCDELVRRYPDLGPVIKACEPLAAAAGKDGGDAQAEQARCARSEPDGYAVLVAKCRKPVTVVPPVASPPVRR